MRAIVLSIPSQGGVIENAHWLSVVSVCFGAGITILAATVPIAAQSAQDMVQHLDLSSPG